MRYFIGTFCPFLFFIASSFVANAQEIYFEPAKWQYEYEYMFANIIFSGYNKNDKYVILVDTHDGPRLDKFYFDKKFNRLDKKIYLEYRCIKPETAIKISDDIMMDNKMIGILDSNCDCDWSKQLYDDVSYLDNNKHITKYEEKTKDACYGYREYSKKEMMELYKVL